MVGIIYPNMIVIVSSSVLSVNKTKVFIVTNNLLWYVDSNVCIHPIAFWIQNANVLEKQGICRKWKKNIWVTEQLLLLLSKWSIKFYKEVITSPLGSLVANFRITQLCYPQTAFKEKKYSPCTKTHRMQIIIFRGTDVHSSQSQLCFIRGKVFIGTSVQRREKLC